MEATNPLAALTPYELRHLPVHLEEAGRATDLHRLLRLEWRPAEQSASTRNAWFAAKDQIDETAGYLADVQRAWALAARAGSQAADDAARSEAVGLQCRYAIVTASVNSLAAQIGPGLLAALVEHGDWTPGRGLTYAARMPVEQHRAEALASLAPLLPASLLNEALAVAWGIGNAHWRALALAGFAARVAPPERARILADARSNDSEDSRAEALIRLARPVPDAERPGLLAEALQAVTGIGWDEYRHRKLAERVPQLVDLGYDPSLALDLIVELPDEDDRAAGLSGLAPHLPEALIHRAVPVAQGFRAAYHRAYALGHLVARLPEGERWPLLEQALGAARAIELPQERAGMLGRLAPHLPEPLVREAIAAARRLERSDAQAAALAKLAPRLAALGYPQEALELVRALPRHDSLEGARAAAFLAIAPYLLEVERPAVLADALRAAHATGAERPDGTVLVEVAEYLPAAQQSAVLFEALRGGRFGDGRTPQCALAAMVRYGYGQEALAHARAIGDARALAEALAALIPLLPERARPEPLAAALAAVEAMTDDLGRADLLVRLAGYLPCDLLDRALAAARAMKEGGFRAQAMAVLAPRLAALGHTGEALRVAQAIRDSRQRARALAGVAAYLPAVERPKVLAEALAAAKEMTFPANFPDLVAELAPAMPAALRKQALRSARSLSPERAGPGAKARALAAIAPYLPPRQRAAIVAETLAAAQAISQEERRAQALMDVLPRLAQLGYADAALEAFRHERWWGEEGKDYRAMTLAKLAPCVPEFQRPALLAEALAAVRQMEIGDYKARALVDLVSRLSGDERAPVAAEALAAARDASPPGDRARLLASLAPYLPDSLLHDLIEQARSTEAPAERGFVLSLLAARPVRVPAAVIYPLWSEALRWLAAADRASLLRQIGALAPVMAYLGRETAVIETANAVIDAGRWFP